MADSLPVPAAPAAMFTPPPQGPVLERLRHFSAQPAVRRAAPWFGGVAILGAAALAWSSLAPSPQRMLYSQLDDAERAGVVATLDKAGIHYKINSDTGALTVDEGDLYKARALVAQNGALATPDSATDSLDKLPLGASKTLEGERLRAAREHELMLTIKQIDGVEAVRVHLAEGEKSVFVRDNLAPSASVMVKLAAGRQLSQSQVAAVVNLVAGSVPGLTPDAVKVVDQHGRLLTDHAGPDGDRLELQTRLEAKYREAVSQLLTPMLGEGNFSSEIAVDLDPDQVTSARESYDKQGVVRSETLSNSQTMGAGSAAGVPGVLSNTPPPQATPSPGAPKGTPAATTPGQTTGENTATRHYELGREVAVTNREPGRVRRLSVAVALSQAAMKKFKPQDVDQIKQLVGAAVGADPARGDSVAVMVRSFDAEPPAALKFYETPWFASLARTVAALLGVLLVLLLGVRPLIKALRPAPQTPEALALAAGDEEGEEAEGASPLPAEPQLIEEITDPATGRINTEALSRHVGLAQALIEDKPENAVLALRQMLQSEGEGAPQ
ncbi:MAG: flagellar M-ring protein FliF [Proteobacteria bacterium]|nr:flagellar M-ring protein FliF [Pseudomonadota bacterium]